MQPVGRLAELVEDWKHRIRQDGLRSALPAVGMEIARLPYRHLCFLILARSLTEPLPDLHPRIALEIRPFQQADLALLQTIDRPSEVKLCERRLADGHTGLLALHNGRPAGHVWGCDRVNPHLERIHLQLLPGDILYADVYTAPALRGKGVQTALTLAFFRWFRERGYSRAVCYIEAHNGPSLAVWQRKTGSRIIGQVDFVRIGAWYRVRVS